MSETISAAQSIAGVLKKVKSVGKDSKNTAQGWNFRGIDAVVNAVYPALAEVGGFVVPNVLDQSIEHGTTKGGGAMTTIRLRVRYDWYGTDGGEPISGEVYAEAFDTSDKGTAKAMSVAFRTYLLQTLMLPTDDVDPDADYIERGGSVPAVEAPPEGWELAIAGATTVDQLEKIYAQAQKDAWLNDEVMSSLNVRRNQIEQVS